MLTSPTHSTLEEYPPIEDQAQNKDIRTDVFCYNGRMKLLALYDDPYWESDTLSHIRFTSRVFVRNAEGNYGFLKIVGEDGFGKRNHLETCGGGIEDGESFLEGAKREVLEEIGGQASNYRCIGAIIDRLNPIQRLTYNVFFVADLVSLDSDLNRTDEEKILIEDVVWLSPDEALKQLKQAENPIDAFVHRRDLTAFLELLKNPDNRT